MDGCRGCGEREASSNKTAKRETCLLLLFIARGGNVTLNGGEPGSGRRREMYNYVSGKANSLGDGAACYFGSVRRGVTRG